MDFRKTFTLSAAIALVLFVTAFVVTAHEDVEDVFHIESTIWPNGTRGPVLFTHEKHAEDYSISCDQCHHVYVNGENIWQEGDPVDRCQTCHFEATVEGERRLPPDDQKLNLKLAFHNLCQDCHRAEVRKDRTSTAPTTCRGCHSSPR